jgi:hypothetical protein
MKDPETYDEYYLLIDAFISGGKIWTFFPNVQDCSYYSHVFLNKYNETYIILSNFSDSSYLAVRNVSQLISREYAESYLYCHLTVVDGYVFYLSEQEKYNSTLDYFQAYLQNMIGNIITINNLYNRIIIAEENEDQQLIYFILGKIFYNLADFEPIDLEDLEMAPIVE